MSSPQILRGTSPQVQGPAPVTKRKILIVEKNDDAAREVAGRLIGLGYEVAAIAASIDEAIATKDHDADLALMNVVLPDGTNNVAAANALRQQWEIPVVFIIAETDEASMQRNGVTAYVVQPFTDRELRANIELALSKREAAIAMRDLEDRFFANSNDLLVFLDFGGRFKRVNSAWERTFGFTRQELMSRPFIDFVHPDDRERTLKQNAEVRSGGQALSFENRYRCKNGSYKWLRWNAASDSPEKVIYGVARDVTASKMAEEEREQLVRELQAALAEVRTLQEILPICSYCRKIRDDENYWHTVEGYISTHTSTRFSHSICPSCMSTRVDS